MSLIKKRFSSLFQDIKKSEENTQSSAQSGNFLAQGHHPQKLVSEGGGVRDWGPSNSYYHHQGISAMENFVRYATSVGYPPLKQNWNPLANNYPHLQYQRPPEFVSHYHYNHFIENERKPNGYQVYPGWCPPPTYEPPPPPPPPPPPVFGSNIKKEPLWFQRKEPWGLQTEFISTPSSEEKSFPKIPFGVDPRLNEPVEKLDENDGLIKKVPASYVYHGDGGPARILAPRGPWCCRQGNKILFINKKL